MTSILQLRAQFESLANQYADNEDEAALCATRRDEGILNMVLWFYGFF